MWGDDDKLHIDEFEENIEVDSDGANSEHNESVIRNEATMNSQEHIIQGRERRKPSWMEDFVTGEGLSEEDEAEIAYIIQDVTSEDPILFEEAVKKENILAFTNSDYEEDGNG